MLTRYASVLQVRDNHGGPRNCHWSGAGREAPGKTSHYSREAILGLSYHVPHLVVVRVGQAAAAASENGSGPTGIITIRIRVRPASWNVMKPRIQCVQTPWMQGFMTAI
jgi:hypothetical protein